LPGGPPPPDGGEMTTEIAIINRQAIALAADSAVTVGRDKIWKSANKIFSLAPHNDVAIMIHNSGEFVGHPWEPIIKTFREQCGAKRFETVADLATAFFKFIGDSRFSNKELETAVATFDFLDRLEAMKKRLTYKGKMEFRSAFQKYITNELSSVCDKEVVLSKLTKMEFESVFDEYIIKLTKDVLKEHVTIGMRKTIVNLFFEIFRRKISSNYDSGIVFAGYGKAEMFPRIIYYAVDGKFRENVRYWLKDDHDLNVNPLNVAVMPFGQPDMIVLFMEGIVSVYKRFIKETLENILKDKSESIVNAFVKDDDQRLVETRLQKDDNALIVEKFIEGFRAYREERYVDPVLQVLNALPKEEMAAMAEALVELTSLRRKVASKTESVGGPTDVAIISKGDGIIWVKRKHYFDIAMNQDFLYRKNSRLNGGNYEEKRAD
jgi:hypothetical protein